MPSMSEIREMREMGTLPQMGIGEVGCTSYLCWWGSFGVVS